MSEETTVRRARRSDIPAIVALVQMASRSEAQVGEPEVTQWLFSKGLWVALPCSACQGGQDGDRADRPETHLTGVAAWQAENLLSVTDVFYVYPGRLGERGGGRLLEAIEAEATILMCEANVIVLPMGTPQAMRTFLQQQGYELRQYDTLHRIWREVLRDLITGEVDLMVKQLREQMIMVPI